MKEMLRGLPAAADVGTASVASGVGPPDALPALGGEISTLEPVTEEKPGERAVRVTSSVVFVSDLSRSVGFYRDLFSCEVTFEADSAALLLTPGGFQIYLIERGERTPHSSGGIGLQYLIWAVDSATELDDLERAMRARGNRTDRHTSGDITFLTGRDPDGIRIVVAHPSPAKLRRVLVDNRLYA